LKQAKAEEDARGDIRACVTLTNPGDNRPQCAGIQVLVEGKENEQAFIELISIRPEVQEWLTF
jgi:hypothetical protein